MEVFAYTTGTPERLNSDNLLSLCGLLVFRNVHHEDRNSHPFSLDKEDGLLSPFSGPNYRDILNQLFQTQTGASLQGSEPSTENKLERLKTEITFWDTFSDACLETDTSAIFDLGVCGSAARADDYKPQQCTLLDNICLTIESRRTKMMRTALNPGAEDPSLLSLQETFYGSGKPSPFLLKRIVQQCGSGIVAGSDSYVSQSKRLVIEDDMAWLSDLHPSYDFRRIVLCAHCLETIGIFEDSEDKNRFSEYFLNLRALQEVPPLPDHVMSHMNHFTRILRGVCCEKKISIHRNVPQKSLAFTNARSKWKAIRELINMRSRGCFPEGEIPDNRPASLLVNALKCGVHVLDGFCFATWQNENAEGIDGNRLASEVTTGSFEISAFIDAASNLEAIEMLLWIDMVLKFRKLSKSDAHGGLFAIDVSLLNFTKHPDNIFKNADEQEFDEDELDEQVDSIILAATGIGCMQQLEPLTFDTKYVRPQTLAASIDQLLRKNSSDSPGRIIPGDSWMLESTTRRKVNVLKENTRYVIELLPSHDVISYNHACSRRIARLVAKTFRGISVFAIGMQFDLSSVFEAGAADTSDTLNALLRGSFGVEGLRYGLRLIFMGMVKVRRGQGSPTCYVPEIAHDEKGLIITSFLPSKLMSQATYFERGGDVYWLPGEGMNIFKVESRSKSKITHFQEVTEHSEIVEKVGTTKIVFKVG